ncbi:MAG: hypothetical protein ACWGMZ_01175 [Thermoguttaceae bacterium]
MKAEGGRHKFGVQFGEGGNAEGGIHPSSFVLHPFANPQSLIPNPFASSPFCLLPSAFILAFFSLLFLGAELFGQTAPAPEIVDVQLGFAGRCKVGLWTPIQITIRGGSESLSGVLAVTVPDGDCIPSRVLSSAEQPCKVLPNAETKTMLYVRIGRVSCDLKIEFIVDGRTAAAKTLHSGAKIDKQHFLEPLQTQTLLVSLGRRSLGIDDDSRFIAVDFDHRPFEAHLDRADQLPERRLGYEAVSAVLLCTSQADLLPVNAIEGDRLEALDQWIIAGGRLVLCVGSRGEELASTDSPLKRFFPGKLEEMVSYRQLSVWETYCNSSAPIPQTHRRLKAPKLAHIQGVVEAQEADLPLIIRTPRGLGQIVFVAADLDQAPLKDWSDRNLLLAKLLDLPISADEEFTQGAALSHFGYIDLAGQLRSALDSYPGVSVIPFSVIAAALIFYLLLIGPGDYFFLRKIVRRMQWTWLSFPLIILLFCAAAYFLACRLKGDRVHVNQVDLVDVDASTGQLNGTSWLSIFSPQTKKFDLSLQVFLPNGKLDHAAQSWIAWLGLEGKALGGMNSPRVELSRQSDQYDFSPKLNAMLGVPIRVYSSKSFTARWLSPQAESPQAELSQREQSIFGTLVNTLDFPLRRCFLAHKRWAYELGTLAPGEAVKVDQTSKRSELKTLLTGKKMIFDKTFHQEITPYDIASTNVAFILRVMMFYKAIDGRAYTKLENGYQTFVDLSDLLATDRAILVAEGPETSEDEFHGASLLLDGKPLGKAGNKHKTLYRFIFSVQTTQ